MTESTGKRLELLREIAPRARRIACLTNPEDALGTQQFQTAQQAGPSVGMQVVELDARNETQLRKALAQLSRSGFDGILINFQNDTAVSVLALGVLQVAART